MTPLTRGWQPVLQGLAAIAFGVLALIWPGLTAVVLALLFGAYALVDGVTALVAFARRRYPRRRAGYLVTGILGVIAGLLTVIWPGITVLVLAVVIGIWAIVTGAIGIWLAAMHQRRRWSLLLVGVAAVAAGILLLIWPAIGAATIARIVGAYAIVAGAITVAGAWPGRRSPSRQGTAPAGV